jgi:glycosyltransferase involved in cell wall biosynthesis
MESLLRQVDERFEFVIVDNPSTDGSHDYLGQLAAKGSIRLISVKCNRGQGRQIAVENASGDVVIQQVDADQVYSDFLAPLVDAYEKKRSQDPDIMIIVIPAQNTHLRIAEKVPSYISIVNKATFMAVSGWPPLQYGEDRHFFDWFEQNHHLTVMNLDASKQAKSGLAPRLYRQLIDQKELLNSGYSYIQVVKMTKQRGLLYWARALSVTVAYLVNKLSKKDKS